jgi:hypothetical protein
MTQFDVTNVLLKEVGKSFYTQRCNVLHSIVTSLPRSASIRTFISIDDDEAHDYNPVPHLYDVVTHQLKHSVAVLAEINK